VKIKQKKRPKSFSDLGLFFCLKEKLYIFFIFPLFFLLREAPSIFYPPSEKSKGYVPRRGRYRVCPR
jgi:hypothetical protein